MSPRHEIVDREVAIDSFLSEASARAFVCGQEDGYLMERPNVSSLWTSLRNRFDIPPDLCALHRKKLALVYRAGFTCSKINIRRRTKS